MRRAGASRVVRMSISGHKTDSMERRYNIVDGEDLKTAKELMEQRKKKAVAVSGEGRTEDRLNTLAFPTRRRCNA